MLEIGVTETSIYLSVITNLKLYLMYLTTCEAACYNTVLVSVCQTITFESLDVESLYLHIRYISREYIHNYI